MWWWFVIHGLLGVAFGIFTLATPYSDTSSFLLDGCAFALFLFLSGTQVAIQAILSRGFGRGWGVLLAAGVHAAAAGIVLWTIAMLALPYAHFWSGVSFLLVEGLLLMLGLLRSPAYRLWGLLMGSCMIVAAALMTAAWLPDPEHSFDVPDLGMGIAGLLYGMAVFVAALQVRAAYYRADQTRRA